MAPKVLYHFTDPKNRESIQMHGLSPDFDFTGYGAVFLATSPLDTSGGSDVWRVYTQGIDVVDDVTTPGFEGDWYMVYGVIPPDRLELLDDWEKGEHRQAAPYVYPEDAKFGMGLERGKTYGVMFEESRPVTECTFKGVYMVHGEPNAVTFWIDNNYKAVWRIPYDHFVWMVENQMIFPLNKADTLNFIPWSEEEQEYYRASKWAKTAENYMGWPKFEAGDAVVALAYGDPGTIKGVKWDSVEEAWWYYVDTYDEEGFKDHAFYPETDLARASIYFDRGKSMDEPGAWTMEDLGIPPSAEQYYRQSRVVRLDSGISEEHGEMQGRFPWIWSPATETLFIGTGGGTHSGILRALRDDKSLDPAWYDDAWQGVYLIIKHAVVVHSHYDVNRFDISQFPISMLLNLQQGFRNPDELIWLDEDGDWAGETFSDMISKMASSIQPQLDTIRSTYEEDVNARTATEALTAAGGRVFIVGGAVRDAFLGRASKDVDLMCAGLTGEEISAALAPLGPVKLTGEAFGVYRFRTHGTSAETEVEIALPRTEQSTGEGHKDFQVVTDPYLDPTVDLQRRDFTGNAMAYDPVGNELLDPHGGADDLTARRLRLVNDNALAEDPLRIVRALVANARFGLQPDEDLLDALNKNAHKLKSLPGERIQMEMDKLLAGDDPAGAMVIAENTGLIDRLVPELAAAIGFDQMNPHHNLTVYDHTMAVLRAMSRLSSDPDMRLAALFHDSGKPRSFWRDEDAPEGGGGHFYKKVKDDGTEIGEDHEAVSAELVEAYMNRLRYPKDRIKRVTTLVANHMFPYFSSPKGARKFLAALDGDVQMANDLMLLREADSSGKKDGQVGERDRKAIDKARAMLDEVLAAPDSAVTIKDLAVNGHDLMSLGLKGRAIGEAQKKLLEIVIDNPDLNNRESLLRLLSDGLIG